MVGSLGDEAARRWRVPFRWARGTCARMPTTSRGPSRTSPGARETIRLTMAALALALLTMAVHLQAREDCRGRELLTNQHEAVTRTADAVSLFTVVDPHGEDS